MRKQYFREQYFSHCNYNLLDNSCLYKEIFFTGQFLKIQVSRDNLETISTSKGPVTRGNFLCSLQCNADHNETLQVAGKSHTSATLFATRNATHSLPAISQCELTQKLSFDWLFRPLAP